MKERLTIHLDSHEVEALLVYSEDYLLHETLLAKKTRSARAKLLDLIGLPPDGSKVE